MKLRIRGDSIRLRLTQAEVREIGEGNSVQEVTHFLQGARLHYIVVPTRQATEIDAQLRDHQIVVRIPLKLAQDWASSEQIAIKFEQKISENKKNTLFILIEKDFACLKTRENENEDESDMFPNPNAATGCCG